MVGCNTGKDCSYFIKYGAKEVHGLDVIDDIGSEFKHPKVKYSKISAEKMKGIKTDTYDLVYCFATMEHVLNIQPAFKEMVRVTKPGGFIYSVAAPLWNSRNGHHKSEYFDSYPWIHLRLKKDEILKYCTENNIKDLSGNTSMKHHVDYMLNPKYFNKTPASAYLSVCKKIKMITNNIDYDEKSFLTSDIYKELTKKGFTKKRAT